MTTFRRRVAEWRPRSLKPEALWFLQVNGGNRAWSGLASRPRVPAATSNFRRNQLCSHASPGPRAGPAGRRGPDCDLPSPSRAPRTPHLGGPAVNVRCARWRRESLGLSERCGGSGVGLGPGPTRSFLASPGVGRLCGASVSASVTRGPRCSLHGAVVSGRRKHAPFAARPEGGPGEIGVDGAAAHGRDPESGSEAVPEGSGCGGGGMKRRLGTQRRRRGGETLPSPQGEALGRLGLIPSAATSANLL